MAEPTLKEDFDDVCFHFDFLGDEYAEEDHDDPEMLKSIQSGIRLIRAINKMEHVAWCRYSGNTIVTCDSDAPGAFKVYRDPLNRD
jgi:hypothetical protein